MRFARFVIVLLCTIVGCNRAPINRDREITEWVLAHAGQALVESNGFAYTVRRSTEVPDGELRLTKISWDIYPGDRNTHVKDSDLELFASLGNLRELDLWASDVTDAGVAYLTKIGTLERLQLSQTRITDRGIKQLGSLKQLKQLAILETQVTVQAVRSLQRQLPECKITHAPLSARTKLIGERHP